MAYNDEEKIKMKIHKAFKPVICRLNPLEISPGICIQYYINVIFKIAKSFRHVNGSQ